jgi:hypothetical protein
LLIHWICIPRPVLHLIDASVRLGPVDPYRVHVQFFSEAYDHPLRMKRVILAGEGLREIRIALPIGPCISVVEPRIAIELGSVVTSEPAVWK